MGLIANEICERAKVADLVVIGHRGVNEGFPPGFSVRPPKPSRANARGRFLFRPKSSRRSNKPLLAYDGSQRASSAMESAAEFCAGLKLPLTVLTVAKEEAGARNNLQQAKAYLACYAIEVNYETTRGYPEQKIIEQLVNSQSRPAVHRRLRPSPDYRDGARQHDGVCPAQCALPGVSQ